MGVMSVGFGVGMAAMPVTGELSFVVSGLVGLLALSAAVIVTMAVRANRAEKAETPVPDFRQAA